MASISFTGSSRARTSVSDSQRGIAAIPAPLILEGPQPQPLL
jgi:hypothetical protein